MKILKWFVLMTFVVAMLISCSDDSSTGPDDEDIVLVINEFMASNDYGPVDEFGNHGDWIEIYNAGNDDVDLAGMYITDDLTDLMVWQIPGSKSGETTVEAGGFIVLWADKEPDLGPLHVNIKLSGDGEDIALTMSDGVTVLDQLTYDAQTTDISYGRNPDGSDTWEYFGEGYPTMPSPGFSNGTGELPYSMFIINEFMASNDYSYVDENGENDDWIEIQNTGNIPGDIGGLYITDDLEELNTWQIPTDDPEATTIMPGEFLILWADKEPEQGVLHVDIKLSGDGEAIALTEADATTVIDSLTYGEQTTDVSMGRMPDGSDTWAYFGEGYATMPTPGFSNGTGEAPMAKLMINEFLASNDSCYADPEGEFDDWIEIYNDGNIPADLGGMYITDDLGDLMMWQIPDTDPDLTAVYPGAYLILWADKEPAQGVLHVDIKLDADGEDIGFVENDGITIVDSYTFGPQETDVSEGRVTDGADEWQFFEDPTPGASNQ